MTLALPTKPQELAGQGGDTGAPVRQSYWFVLGKGGRKEVVWSLQYGSRAVSNTCVVLLAHSGQHPAVMLGV